MSKLEELVIGTGLINEDDTELMTERAYRSILYSMRSHHNLG